MAAAKKGAERKAGNPAIVGTVRFNGTTYTAGQEEDLKAAMKEANVESVRGFGVDSTDRGGKALGRSDTRRAEIAARQAQARAEAAGESVEGDEGEKTDYTSVTLDELEAALANESDLGQVRKAKRRDSRSGAAAYYDARIEAIKAAEDEGE